MMVTPLTVARMFDYGGTVHGHNVVSTWTGAGTRRTTFAELLRDGKRLANALRGLGVTGDQRVATFQWNNAEHLTAYYAVPAMGAVLHTLNLRLFPDQVAYIANHAEDHVVIVDSSLIPLLARTLPEMKTVEHVIVTGDGDVAPLGDRVTVHRWDELLAGASDEFEWPEVDENDAAALCYTSGTTGNPKGVAYSHRSIWLHSMQVCMTEGFGISSGVRELVIVPMFHAMSWGIPYAAIMSGAELLLPDRFLQAEPIARMIEAERPTRSSAVPTIWGDLLTYLDTHGGDVSSIKEVTVGGSACPPAMMHAYQERYGIRILHAWGMTEMSPLGTIGRTPPGISAEEEWKYRYTQGRVPAAVQARIVGPGGDVMPYDGQSVGELEVRGPWITGRYLGEDGPDPEKFSPDGWLRTGDVGHLTHNGYLTLTDRAKDVIKSGGEWISSVDLENALMAHPAVQEACVVGVPDEKWGERPLATVVLRPEATATVEDLRAFLGETVAKWQLPERWAFIQEVPKTSVGKYDKKRVRAQYADGDLSILGG
ncbi:fatty-acyl-CoA synthase [Virgisporangium aliadipatigenens]|uniref:Fatty-acyl-CoA synthase n=2 Tax=Virgisporangium aliadipatigenens TaxID=741659 RepID=A0A8J3YZ00_9ACTN|nr:fatty-acyl-CoA synthase [Virgisporangium aliadipatigenens]